MLIRVQTRCLRLGLFQSICSTIKYQARKANVVSDVLSKIQRKNTEDSNNDLSITTTVEEQVLELSGISVELSAEDLQKWTTAYKEDKSYAAMYS